MHVILIIIIAVAAFFLWRWWQKTRIEALRKEAVESFSIQLPGLANQFLEAAEATGKPRGLRWKNCELSGEPFFAKDRVTGEIYALVTATISFEAIAGGGMEDVEAVGNLRCATAVFVYRDGSWTSDGQAVFNLEPAQSIERFEESLEPLGSA